LRTRARTRRAPASRCRAIRGSTPAAELGWPLLDTLSRRLATFNHQFASTELQLRADSATPAADSRFLAFRTAYMAVAESLTDLLDNDSLAQALAITQGGWEDSLRALLQRNGFDLNSTEGHAFVDEDVAHLLRTFGPLLTPAMREYLSIRSTEREARFSEDAGLRISWDSLSERIAVWERFLAENPGFAWRTAAQGWRDMYLATYLTGMDNSRTLTDSGMLDPDVRRSYEEFLRHHGDTPAGEVVRDFLALLAAGPVPSDAAINEFLRDHHLQTMLGVQPPVN
jgi:hypothetical protein